MDRPSALVVGEDAAARKLVREVLDRHGIGTVATAEIPEALETLSARRFLLLVVDLDDRETTENDVIERASRLRPRPLIVGLTGKADERTLGTQQLREQLFDVLPKPVEPQRFERVAVRARSQAALLEEMHRLRNELRQREGYAGIVGRSSAMQRLRAELQRLSASDLPLWFRGEAGTGKELAARTLHVASARRDRPFVPLNCSELTNENWRVLWLGSGTADGVLRQADGGTLYLEEAPDLPLELQQRLAAFLEGQSPAEDLAGIAGVRLLASSRIQPRQAVEQGRLLPAIERRLAALTMPVPPLRQRVEDIALLANHFIDLICEVNQLAPIRISPEALAALQRHHWPGNVQELRNAVEHAVILAKAGVIRPVDLPDRVREAVGEAGPTESRAALSERPFREAKREVVAAFERAYLRDLLERHAGNVTAAARQAGMLRSALQRLLRKYGLKSADFRTARPRRRSASAPTSSDSAR